MAKAFLMPKLDMTMEEGQISSWAKKEGERVERGELLLEVNAEKAVMEVESTLTGFVLKILVDRDETAKVNQPICIIGEAGEDISDLVDQAGAASAGSPAAPAQAEQFAQSSAWQTADESGRVKASPAARRASKETGISLGAVGTPSGPDGRILEADVMKLFRMRSEIVKATPVAKAIAAEKGVDLAAVAKGGIRAFKDDVLNFLLNMQPPQAKSVKLSALRRASAAHLAKSAQSVPHVTNTMEVDMTAALGLCDRLNDRLREAGVKVSPTDVMIKAISFALLANPEINARLEADTAVYSDRVNIGLAVALDDGLIVPVLKDADKCGLLDLIDQKKELVKKAKSHSLSSAEVSGGSITLTNLGMYGVDIFTPIINIPESSILGAGQIKKRAVVVDDEVVVRPMMWLSYSYDHRLIDGVPASRFLKCVKEFLETPELMFLR